MKYKTSEIKVDSAEYMNSLEMLALTNRAMNMGTIEELRKLFKEVGMTHVWSNISANPVALKTAINSAACYIHFLHLFLEMSDLVEKIIMTNFLTSQPLFRFLQDFICQYYRGMKNSDESINIDIYKTKSYENATKFLFPPTDDAEIYDIMQNVFGTLRTENNLSNDIIKNELEENFYIHVCEDLLNLSSNEEINRHYYYQPLITVIKEDNKAGSLQELINNLDKIHTKISEDTLLEKINIIEFPKYIYIYWNRLYYDNKDDMFALKIKNKITIGEKITINNAEYLISGGTCLRYDDPKSNRRYGKVILGNEYSYIVKNDKCYMQDGCIMKNVVKKEVFDDLYENGLIILLAKI